jgi:hypothetical protein
LLARGVAPRQVSEFRVDTGAWCQNKLSH